MATIREVEDEITALTKRHADLDNKMVGYGGVDLSVGKAMSVVDKQIRELERCRTALLAGESDPADSASPPQLRPPRWITKKETRATAAEVHEQNVETAKLLPLETSIDDLGELYGTEEHLAVVESALREYSVEIVENGRACEFNEGMYAALLTMFYRESAARAVTLHWAGNQRRLVEQRVEALESSLELKHIGRFNSSELQRLTAYLTPQFDTAPLLKRIDQLEQHQMQLEQHQMKYRGVWAADEQYTAGNFCTDHGSLWHCNQTTRERPGGDGLAWTLAVKRGQDGRDGRAK